MQRISVVILDLDNTLFDWVDIWHQSFKAMLDELIRTSGIEQEVLLNDFKAVFTRHGTSEYAFALEELESLQAKHPGENITQIYDSAIHAYRSARKDSLALFPDVEETLQKLKDAGCLLTGYTESMAYYSHYRMRKLGLDRLLDYIYSPADHDLPQGMTAEQIRIYPTGQYKLRRTVPRHTPKGELKPNPEILLQIIRDVAASPEEVLYIGDSLMKDISMAKDAKVTDAWAKYGIAQTRPEYELLRRVTHWTASSVEKEKGLSEDQIKPTLTLNQSLADVLPAFSFEPYIDRSPDQIETVVDAWKTTVDVQKHFNELEMKVRNFALTILGAILAGAAFSVKEQVEVGIWGTHIPLATLVLLAGAAVWIAFYLMDRHWYHNLLLGSVTHGLKIEKRYSTRLPELGLATAIGAASPTIVGRRKIRSSHKLDIFYGGGLVLLILAAFVSFFVVGKTPQPNNPTQTLTIPAGNNDTVKPVSNAASDPEPTLKNNEKASTQSADDSSEPNSVPTKGDSSSRLDLVPPNGDDPSGNK
jgi:phosphoglycolate phosphatase-like HAD superfamily hydrolase